MCFARPSLVSFFMAEAAGEPENPGRRKVNAPTILRGIHARRVH